MNKGRGFLDCFAVNPISLILGTYKLFQYLIAKNLEIWKINSNLREHDTVSHM